jgi:hypothetical protein
MRGDGELRFSTTRPGAVRVEVFDPSGRLVQKPVDEFLGAGRHVVSLQRRDGKMTMSPGCYFYRVRTAEGVKQGRITIVE